MFSPEIKSISLRCVLVGGGGGAGGVDEGKKRSLWPKNENSSIKSSTS